MEFVAESWSLTSILMVAAYITFASSLAAIGPYGVRGAVCAVGGSVVLLLIAIAFSDTPPAGPADEIKATYGLSLTAGQVLDLRYPEERPGSETKRYGTTTLTDDEGTQSAHLRWDGQLMLLVDDAGAELPRVGR